MELPERADSYLNRAARERGLSACAGRAQASLYLMRPLQRELTRVADAGNLPFTIACEYGHES